MTELLAPAGDFERLYFAFFMEQMPYILEVKILALEQMPKTLI